MKTMACEIVGRISIVVHGADPPSKDEWDDYLNQIRTLQEQAGLELARGFAVTEGGGPSFSQRQQLHAMMKLRPVQAAVVSSNAFIRTMAAAFSVFNPRLKVFRPETIPLAFQYLGLSEPEKKAVLRTTTKLQAELGISSASGK